MADSALEGLALAIAAAITGNPNFPEPTLSLSALNDSINAYSDALALAKTRDKVKVAIKISWLLQIMSRGRMLPNRCLILPSAVWKLYNRTASE
jgi:hypothetical protein